MRFSEVGSFESKASPIRCGYTSRTVPSVIPMGVESRFAPGADSGGWPGTDLTERARSESSPHRHCSPVDGARVCVKTAKFRAVG